VKNRGEIRDEKTLPSAKWAGIIQTGVFFLNGSQKITL